MINLCTSQPTTGTSNIVPFKAGVKAEISMKGRNIRLENTVFRNRTGSTALSRNDFFLNAS